jgi:hypothetical protein
MSVGTDEMMKIRLLYTDQLGLLPSYLCRVLRSPPNPFRPTLSTTVGSHFGPVLMKN